MPIGIVGMATMNHPEIRADTSFGNWQPVHNLSVHVLTLTGDRSLVDIDQGPKYGFALRFVGQNVDLAAHQNT